MTMQRTTDSELQTQQLAEELGRCLRGGEIITLEGPLGAGKTCFVRGLATGLGIDPKQVSSPTFVVSQEYTSENRATLVHIDAYRLHGADELETIGWEELVSSPSIIIAVEWPSRIASALRSLTTIDVTLEPISPSSRVITISAHEDHATRLERIP